VRQSSVQRPDYSAAQAIVLPIVWDAAVATGAVGDGRMGPPRDRGRLNRPGVAEMVRLTVTRRGGMAPSYGHAVDAHHLGFERDTFTC
jgi:hypothetical protein